MRLSSDTIEKLKKINFVESYKLITANHQHDINDMYGAYTNPEVLNMLESIGRKATYNKKENFFKVVTKKGNYRFQFNISLKYGCCEFIWGLRDGDEKILLGPWGLVMQLMGIDRGELRKASFTSYDELKSILTDAFKLYDDFLELL